MPIARLTDRAVLAVGGPDARDWLQGLVTNDVARLTPATPLWCGLLSPQGKILFDMILFDGSEQGPGTVLIDVVDRETTRDGRFDVATNGVDGLLRRLNLYRLRRDVEIAAVPDLAVFAAWGDPVAGQPCDPRLAALGQRWIAATAPMTADFWDYELHRFALGIPASNDMIGDRMLWLEANAVELNGVSFTKGCYVGQENTARMYHRGKVRKRLLPVTLGDGIEDRTIMADGTAIGDLRGIFRRADGPGWCGIAFLKVEEALAASVLTAGDVAVTVAWPDWLPRD